MVINKQKEIRKKGTNSRLKLGKLQLGKETLKELTPGKQKQVKGGNVNAYPDSQCRTCSCRAPC